jgi:hypothetical protein
MSISFYFAHNGIDHANQAEAVAHGVGSTLVTLVVTAAILTTIVLVVRRADRAARQEQSTEKDPLDG